MVDVAAAGKTEESTEVALGEARGDEEEAAGEGGGRQEARQAAATGTRRSCWLGRFDGDWPVAEIEER